MTEERNEKGCTGRVAWPMAASIALNLFLVGVVVGPMLRGGEDFRSPMQSGRIQDGRHMPPPRSGGVPGFMLEKVMSVLPAQEAEKFRAIFDQERKAFQARHEDRHKQMQKIAAILKEEKPDMDALRKVMDEIRTSGQGVHEGISRAMERVATEISLEGRRKIADVIEQDRGPAFGPNGNPPPPPPME